MDLTVNGPEVDLSIINIKGYGLEVKGLTPQEISDKRARLREAI